MGTQMWQHGEQWLCMMAMHVHVWACGKQCHAALHALAQTFMVVTTCLHIMHLVVPCVQT